MEPLQQSQPNIQKLTLLSNLPNELPQRDPRPIIPKLAEIKQKAAAKFPNLGLDAYEIVKANDYMYAAQHKTTKEVIVVFTGQNIALIGIASCLVSALKFARDIIKDYNNCKITLTGFGPGAALAERVAYFTGKPCESFNPAPMSQNFDELFHSLANVTERTVQPNSIPRVNVQIKPVRPEETKTNTNGSVSLDNLNYNELARIKGIYMDEKTNACSFVLRPAAEANSLDISVSDLLTALAIFYDPNVNTKHISFSLEPADEKNPQCEQQMKVYWPDKSDSKTILQGTELGEVFFKADYHMKQMSMGVQPTMEAGKPGNKEFAYPERLTKLGVQPSYKYGNYKKGQLDWSRLWLVVKELKVNRLSGNKKVKYFDITDVVMGVEARQMMVSQTGKLEDMQIQDTNHGSYKFAKKFTELYEEIAKEYPVYQRLKQAAKAVALAQWMWVNRVPIDFQRIKGMVKKVTNYTNLVPALEHQFEAEGHTLRVFGGVDMGISLNQLIEPDMKGLMKFEEPKSVQVTSSMLQQPPQFQDSIPNPFVQKANCATCSCRLHLAELLYPHEGNYYCTNHHPLYCWGCYDFIQEKYMKLGNSAAFHADCFTCAKCAHPLSGQLGMIAETAYMHKDCSSSATKELMAARVKDQPSPGQSPSSSGAALTVFQRKLDRVLSMNGNGDAVAYSLIPPSAGSQEGYKLGKTGLDTSGPSGEQLLPVIQNILERTGMDNASAVIEKLKGKKALTQQEINSVNEKLGGFGGKKVIDDIYNRVLAGTASHIDTVIESISDATMKEKVKKSEHAKLLLVDYENQWKLDTRLVAFLSAKTVPVDQTTQVTIDKNADVASEINRLVDMTKVNATNKTEVMRRRNNVEKIAKEETA